MRQPLHLLVLTASLYFPLFAVAQPVAESNPIDCRQTANPERCMAARKAREACQGKIPSERRQCMQQLLPPPNCNKTKDPKRCQALLKVRQNCQGKVGKDYRNCQRRYLAKPLRTPPKAVQPKRKPR
ncbi:hypothetical protein DLREEDagrD3_18090 [Denitratisoma sp. agr-D3]